MSYPLPIDVTVGVTPFEADAEAHNKRYNFEGPKVKADFGAVGNSNHNDGGGADDTTAFQNAINAARDQNVGQVLVEPGTYRITSPLKMFGPTLNGGPIRLAGLARRNAAGTRGPTLVWDGPTDGTARAMLDYDHPTAQNLHGCPVENIVLAGRWIENATAIRFRRKVDMGTWLNDVSFQRWAGDAVIYDQGSTNGYIFNCRWDDCTGYGVRFKVATLSMFGMRDCTWATGNNSLGFFYAERSGSQNDFAFLDFQNINLEVQVSLVEVESGGTDPADRRGLYQFLCQSEHTSAQYLVTFTGLKHDTPSGVASYSAFLARGDGTAAQRGRRLQITGERLSGMGGTDSTAALGYKKPLGNVHANMMATGNLGFYAVFQHKPQNTEIFGSNRPVSHVYVGTD